MAENMREVRQQLPRARPTGTDDLQPMQQLLILDRGEMIFSSTQMAEGVLRRRLQDIRLVLALVLVLVLMLDGRSTTESKRRGRLSCQSRPSST